MNGILIIGASGFLGRQLALSFREMDAVGTCHRRTLPGLEFLDLREPRQLREVLRRLSPSVVLYAAGLTDVDACEKSPDLAWRLNAEAAEEAASWSEARTVYFSTDYVFDGARGLYCEDDKPAPLNMYGRSKLAGERAVLRHNPGNLVVRVSGLYDASGIKGQNFSSARVPVIADDVQLSSPVHVEDVASAVRLLLDTGRGGVYHVAGPDVLSRYEFWQLVALRSTPGASSSHLSGKAARRPRDSSLQTSRIEALGWRARRVCEGLSPLPGERTTGLSRAFAPGVRGPQIDTLLIDCVGALLTGRTWLPKNEALEAVDRACAVATNGTEFRRMAADALSLGDADLPTLYERIAFRYAPNPPVWGHLARWRACYRLALVNNGPAATFRNWVRKYGLDGVFDVLANSEEMGTRKPAPEFFLGVMDQLGAAPNRCLLIDDDPANVEGARRCGLVAIRTLDLKRYPLSIHALEESVGTEALLEVGRADNESGTYGLSVTRRGEIEAANRQTLSEGLDDT